MYDYDEHYFDKETDIRIHCEGTNCWIEVQKTPCMPGSTTLVEVQFLLQPRLQNELPVGPPLLIGQLPLKLQCSRRTRRCSSWAWLPKSIRPDLLNRCHLRVIDSRLNSQSEINADDAEEQ